MAGSTVHLSTLLKWKIDEDAIGYRTERTCDGVEKVVQVFCKLCAKHASTLRKDQRLKGQVLKEIEKYVQGTNFVTKYSVHRHLSSTAHQISLSVENTLRTTNGNDETTIADPVGLRDSNLDQKSVKKTVLPKCAQHHGHVHQKGKEAYRRLFRTAYLMAVEGMPLHSFKTLVRIQVTNGVKLISGTDNTNKAQEFIHELAEAIKEKLASVIHGSNSMAVLANGCQIGKMEAGKEMVLVRLVIGGSPVYYCVGLHDGVEGGETNCESLKHFIDDRFLTSLNMTPNKYTKNIVSVTCDGATTKKKMYKDLLTQMQDDGRPWLIPIGCVSHQVELELKDILLKHEAFTEVKDFLQSVFDLFRWSEQLKQNFVLLSESLKVQIYSLHKVRTTGTQFFYHAQKALDNLFRNWPVLVQLLEKILTFPNMESIHSKVSSILSKLKSYTFLSICALMKQIVDNISKFLHLFEKGRIQCFDILPVVERTTSLNEDILTSKIDSFLEESYAIKCIPAMCELEVKVSRKQDDKRKEANQESVTLVCSGMMKVEWPSSSFYSLKTTVIQDINNCLQKRFQSFSSEVSSNSLWLDPANWYDTTAELQAMDFLVSHFEVPLQHTGFNQSMLKNEWKDFKRTVSFYYKGLKSSLLWCKMFQYRRNVFPNVCLLAEIVMCLGASNSTVERAFGHLKTMCADREICCRHETMEDLLLIKVNDLSWTAGEKDEIIDIALCNYMKYCRKLKIDSTPFNLLNSSRKRKKNDSDSNSDNSDEDLAMDDEDSFSKTENLFSGSSTDDDAHQCSDGDDVDDTLTGTD